MLFSRFSSNNVSIWATVSTLPSTLKNISPLAVTNGKLTNAPELFRDWMARITSSGLLT